MLNVNRDHKYPNFENGLRPLCIVEIFVYCAPDKKLKEKSCVRMDYGIFRNVVIISVGKRDSRLETPILFYPRLLRYSAITIDKVSRRKLSNFKLRFTGHQITRWKRGVSKVTLVQTSIILNFLVFQYYLTTSG